MIPWTLEETAALTGGRLIRGNKDDRISGVVHDTRHVQKGDLFVAIKGERLDGHRFLKQALSRGAQAAMVERWISGIKIPQIVVKDTTKALGDLGKAQRLQWGGLVVAITGSVGKTTVKDMTSHLLSKRFRTLKTMGNLNNQFGVPLTLLKLTHRTQVAVVEIGINHPGEMNSLSEMVRPDVAVVTAIGEAHLGFFKNKSQLALEKMKIASGLREGGIRILNAEDPFLKTKDFNSVSFGLGKGSVRAKNIQTSNGGTRFTLEAKGEKASTQLRMLGIHNVKNALAAVATGLVLGIPLPLLARQLSNFKPQARMRMETKEIKGAWFINDAYNASPTSMKAALETFKLFKGPGRKMVVLGDMLEMGSFSKEAHHRVVKLASLLGIGDLILVGKKMKEAGRGMGERNSFKAHYFDHSQEAGAYLKSSVRKGDMVLLKASRGIQLEKVLEVVES